MKGTGQVKLQAIQALSDIPSILNKFDPEDCLSLPHIHHLVGTKEN